MSRKRGPQLLAFVFAIVAMSLGGYLLRKRKAKTEPSPATATTSSASSSGSTPTTEAPGTKPGSAAPPAQIKRIDPTTRARLAEQVAAARAKRAGSPASAGGGAAGSASQPLDKDYIRTQVRALIPLLTECYTKALEEDPKLGGKLVVVFTIGGEPAVGGLVETSEVDPKESTIANAGMVECVRETMYGAEFVPPPEGGQVEVRYPFEFNTN